MTALVLLALDTGIRPPLAAAVRWGLPLAFIPNRGQFDPGVLYVSHGRSAVMSFARDAVAISVQMPSAQVRVSDALDYGRVPSMLLRMRFIGVGPHGRVDALDPLVGEIGYIRRGLPAGARSGVPLFGRLVYRDLYPGIDLSYERQPQLLKGTFHVRPHARPSSIIWTYGPETEIHVDPRRGELVVRLQDGDGMGDTIAVERRPEAWQDQDGGRIPVEVAYALGAEGHIHFTVGAYDPARELVIDPSLDFTTVIGDQALDEVNGMAVDGHGNVIVVGQTRSGRFPQEPPPSSRRPFVETFSDAFLSKLTPDGKGLVFSRVIMGSRDDAALDVTVDAAGAIYVVGYTQSTDFEVSNEPRRGGRYPLPGDPAGSRDGFVMKLNEQGELEDSGQSTFSTHVGGPGVDEINAIAVGANGLLYLTGRTDSGKFWLCHPLWNMNYKQGGRDAFAMILDPGRIGEPLAKDCSSGLLRYATYYGGLQDDTAHDIVPQSDGSFVLIGKTDSANFPQTLVPLTNGTAVVPDAFAVRINPADPAGPLWSYRIGGQGIDEARSLRVLGDGSLLVAGTTGSADFPVRDAQQKAINAGNPLGSGTDAFALRLNPDGRTLLFSTYIGGSRSDEGISVEQGPDGKIYVAGSTLSLDLPLRGAVKARPQPISSRSGFIVGLGPSGRPMTFSTYFGGGIDDKVVVMAADASDGLYVAGNTRTTVFDGTATSQAIKAQPTVQLGSGDLFVARLRVETATAMPTRTPPSSPTPSATAVPVATATSPPTTAVLPTTATPSPTVTTRSRPAYLPLVLWLWPKLTPTPAPTWTPTATPVVCATAEREPNDLTSQALSLPVLCPGQPISGTLSSVDDAAGNARDLYAVRIDRDLTARFRLDATAIGAQVEYDLTLWRCSDDGCVVIAHRGDVGRREKEIVITLPRGTYFTGVSPRNDLRSDESYVLGWGVVP